MGQKFCASCGASLPEMANFCVACGEPAEPVMPHQVETEPVASPVPAVQRSVRGSAKNIAIIAIVIIIAGIIAFFVLPHLGAKYPAGSTIASTPVPSVTTVPVTTVATTVVVTVAPAPAANPFPDTLPLKEEFHFGSCSTASIGTVYRYWINDTYQWYSLDNKYYTQVPSPGNKYLFVFIQLINIGDTRVWFPPASSIVVYFNGKTYTQDQNHYLPDKLKDQMATGIAIKEVEFLQKLNGDELVEDYGYSHGTQPDFLYPGKSNAIDGYVIYEVPDSLTPDKAFVEIPFDSQHKGVWKLG